ncbi:hypothetical protein OPV22_029889 [Ensete ventricosum]|uniref:Uncharacterized protein n=1 Tax=Ensete ventricosum TaxID=4639 RepID=A0AAV8P7V1_ENSVE|nr:hypothetical protein OPV22_029889 [Ensete ventricosum]
MGRGGDRRGVAGINAILEGYTRYIPNAGILELRKAICRKLEEENAKQYASYARGCLPGDEVLMPVPYYVSYPETARLAENIRGFWCYLMKHMNILFIHWLNTQALLHCLECGKELLTVTGFSKFTSGASSMSQKAGVAALGLGYAGDEAVPVMSHSSYYGSEVEGFGIINDSESLCWFLLDKAAVVPGDEGIGGQPYEGMP